MSSRNGLEFLKKPWLLSDADKCRFASCLVLVQTLPFLGCAWLFNARPELVPYMDRGAVAEMLVLLAVLVWVFFGTLILSLISRSRPRMAKVLTYGFCQLFALSFVAIAYELGQFTTDILGGALLTGSIVGLLLFDRAAVLLGMGVGLLVIVGMTVAQQMGHLPYAPLMAASPVTGHRLAGSWLASVGSLMLVIEVIACGILSYFLYRLRDREAALTRAQQLISRYVPAQVAELLAQGRDDLVKQHARRKLTLFFSDLVGFTEIAERLEPEDLAQVLNEYFTEMTLIARRYDGTVDELSGDAILIFFGAPKFTDDADHALRAVRMARDMQKAMVRLNARWLAAGIEESLDVRMGIDTGVVTIGNFGSEDRMKYAAIGKHINVAARVQARCTPGELLISHATWLLVHEHVGCVPKGEVELKGIHRPVRIYEVSRDVAAAAQDRPKPLRVKPAANESGAGEMLIVVKHEDEPAVEGRVFLSPHHTP